MRFYEFATIKPQKPLTPAQARIAAIKQQVDSAKKRLKTEKEHQRRAKQREQERKARLARR